MSKKSNYAHLLLKKMRRTITRSPLQFLTMVLILGLSTTLFTGLYSSHLAFKNQINEIYEGGNIADITTTLLKNYDENLVKIKESIGEAGTVEAQYHESAKIRDLDGYITISNQMGSINKPYETYYDKTTSTDNYFYISKNYLTVEANYGKRSSWYDDATGKFKEQEVELNNSAINKIVIDEGLGDTLKNYLINDGNNVLASNKIVLKVTPTGTMMHPENILPYITQSFTFITTRTFINNCVNKTISENYNINKLKIDSEKDPDNQNLKRCLELLNANKIEENWQNNRVLTRLKNRNDATIYREKINNKISINDGVLFNTCLQDSLINQFLSNDLNQSLKMCYVFPPFFLLVGVLIVLTTISQVILKERKEIGTLKAFGASTKSILFYYALLTSFVSFIGIALGIILGPVILPIILDTRYSILYNIPKIKFVFPTAFSILLTIVIILVISLVAYLITRKEAKASPVTSMRPKTVVIKQKNIGKDNNDTNTHKLCFKMALRNIFVSKTRSIMVIIGVLGCTGLLCTGFGIDDSIQRGVDNDTKIFFNSDSIMYFSNPTEETLTKINELEVDGKKAITEVEPYAYLPVTATKVGILDKSMSTYVYSMSPQLEKYSHFFNFGGEYPKSNEVFVSNKVAKMLNLHVNDSLYFEFLGKTHPGKVTKIVDVFYLHGIYIDGTNAGYPSPTSYPTCAYARYDESLNKDKVNQAIRDNVPGISKVQDYKETLKQVNDVTSSIKYITATVKIFAMLLAVVALYNLALLNYRENTRNVATMKVLGFNHREISESLFFEIITLSLIGAVLGLAIGYPLTLLTLSINKVPVCEYFYYVAPLSYLYSFLITIVIAVIANIFVGSRSKKIKMVESLKSVE